MPWSRSAIRAWPTRSTIACQGSVPAGSGRWANDRVWLYDFREPLGPARRARRRCARLEAGHRGLLRRAQPRPPRAPPAITGTTRFTFSTGGPAVVADPARGRCRGRGGPALPAAPERRRRSRRASSPTRGARSRASASASRCSIVGGDVRAQVLKARAIARAAAERTLVARCERPLPNGAAMRLVWGKGIAAASNPKVRTTIEQRFPLCRARRLHGRAHLRARARRRAVPADPSVARALQRAGHARARGAAAPAAGQRRAARAGVRQGRQVRRNERGRVPEAARRERDLQRRGSRCAAATSPTGRSPTRRAFPLKVQTGSAPPIAKFAAAPFGIVERNADAMLPVTLRHVQGDLRAPAAGASQRRGGAGARQAPRERRRHPRLVRAPAEVPRDAD